LSRAHSRHTLDGFGGRRREEANLAACADQERDEEHRYRKVCQVASETARSGVSGVSSLEKRQSIDIR
jgi:hypothetical protein